MRVVALPAVILLAALSACGDKTDEGPERKTAAGEVLGGSISDAMLPLATVQSQSPPLRESASDGGDDSKAAESGGDAPEPVAEAATDSPPEPAATASTEPSAKPSE